MSEEENKAIKELKEIKELVEEDLKYDKYEVTATLDQIDLKSLVIVLNLIDKQQKEIEELNTELQIRIAWQQYFEKEYINKDKIREKIKDLEDLIEMEKPTYIETLKYTIDILEELLEENNAK